MFNDNGNIKPWEDIKIEFRLRDSQKIYWLQIIDAFSKSWKDDILKDKRNAKNLVVFGNPHSRKISNLYVALTNLLVKSYI